MELRRSQEARLFNDLGQIGLKLGERLRKAEVAPEISCLIDNFRPLSANTADGRDATLFLLSRFCDYAVQVVKS